MSARISQFWVTLTVVVLVACSGCGKGGGSPTGEGTPSVTATPSAAADTTPATAAATGTGQAQSGGSGSGKSGGGGAQGAPLHIPAIILNIGSDLQTEYDEVFRNVVTECGGTLCVSVNKAGTGNECGYTLTMDGTPVNGDGGTDSQGNQIITVPRGARIVIEGNALGSPTMPCPSDQPAVTVASDWISQGKPIGEPGDGGVFDTATAAITRACSDGASCVSLKVAGGPLLCGVDPQPDSDGDIKVLSGATITLNGNVDGSYDNCPSDGSGSPGSGSSSSGAPGSGSPSSGTPDDQSTPSP